MTADTLPTEPGTCKPANALTIAPAFLDPTTRNLYVHKDLMLTPVDWRIEDHIPPISRTERFGDVPSWAAYVTRFASDDPHNPTTLLTWSERGLSAVLDYHGDDGTPGRCTWLATHDFTRSHAWRRWETLANGRARTQRDTLEALEDLAEDITAPDAATFLGILRKLRTTFSSQAESELLADGSYRIVYTKAAGVKSADGGELALPPEFEIRIAVLAGHTETGENGATVPVVYRLPVKIRVSVDEKGAPAFRLSMPTAERTLEAVYLDRVEAAQALLGEDHKLFRAAI